MPKKNFKQHNLAFIGAGYVGLVSGTALAEIGHNVILVDNNKAKVEKLKKGGIPIFEPGLKELVKKNVKAGRLSFTTSLPQAVKESEAIFIAVNTPPLADGKADLSYVAGAAREIAEVAEGYKVVVDKSTVPVNTGQRVAETIQRYNKRGIDFDIVSNPEFLREGSAVNDFLEPDRIVVGVDNKRAEKIMREIYEPIDAPFIVTDVQSAELIKHASNSFLAMKISFANSLARICELSGANIDQVVQGMGLDKRIGKHFLNAGIGYGGSCFDGAETTFTLNSPNVRAKSFSRLFKDTGSVAESMEKQGNVDIISPGASRTLSFDIKNKTTVVESITTLTRRPYAGPFVTLRTKLGRTLRVTADHPVVVFDPDEQEFNVRPAVNVKSGDHLALALGIPPLSPPATINLLDHLKNHALKKEAWVRLKNNSFEKLPLSVIRAVPRTLMKYPYDIRRTNSMPLAVYFYLRGRGLTQSIQEEELQLFTTKGTPTYCPVMWHPDTHLARLIGYYLSEGWMSQDKGRHGKIRDRIGFAFHKKETEYIQDLHSMLESLGIRYKSYTTNQVTHTHISSRPLVVFLRDVLELGTNSNNKQLPPFALNLPKQARHALLQGLFSGDGSVTPVNGGRNLYLEYATTSKPLAEGMVLLLQSLNIVPATQTKWMNKSTRPAYHIRINGTRQIRQLKGLFGKDRQKDIDTILAMAKRSIAPTGHRRYKNFATVEVTKTTLEPKHTGAVYSMETSNGLLIGPGGLVVHNCFPKDVAAFITIAEEIGYNFDLLKAVEAVNKQACDLFLAKIEQALWVTKGKKIAVWGLAFKPNTDDMRNAPSVPIIEQLHKDGAVIEAYDPEAEHTAKEVLKDKVAYGKDMYSVLKDADALIIITEWGEFSDPDWDKVKKLLNSPVIIDGRNMFDPKEMEKKGFVYHSVGRG